MPLTKQALRRATADLAGDFQVLTPSANGDAGGSTIVLASLNGRGEGADVGKWATVTYSASDVRYGYISESEGTPYTLTIVPALGAQVTTSLSVEISAFPPQYYTTAINAACANVYPWLYEQLYNTSLTVTDTQVYNYTLPSGVTPFDVDTLSLSGPTNTPFVSAPYYPVPATAFLPTGAAGAQQIWLNLLGEPFLVALTVGQTLILRGRKRLTLVTPETTPFRIQSDVSTSVCPQLTEGSIYDQLFRQYVLAELFRVLMAAPATPDRAAYAAAFTTQMAYAEDQAQKQRMPQPPRRLSQ